MVVMLPCCGPHRRHGPHGGVGMIPMDRETPTCSPWPACFPAMARVTSAPHLMQRSWPCPSRLPSLVDFPQKHRDAQPFARGLAWQEPALALRQMPTLAVMLRALMRQEACP